DAQQFRGSLETTWLDRQNFLYWMDAAIDWQPQLRERTIRRHSFFYSGYAFLGKKSKRQSHRRVLFFCSLTLTSSVTAALDLPKPTSLACDVARHYEMRRYLPSRGQDCVSAFPKTQELLLDCAKALEFNLSVLSYMIVLLKNFRTSCPGKTDPLNLPHPPDLEPVRAQLRLLPVVRLVDGLSCDGVRL
ncbi:hypothetical protein B0H14DRAFT_2961728, partial [Mycena olivaceomarginata]